MLCVAHTAGDDRKHHVIARGRDVFALLNLYPYSNGHLLLAPYRHIARFEEIAAAEWEELLRMVQRLVVQMKTLLRAQGFNLGVNLGRVAGAGIPGHLHVHLVPRWQGDSNYMPVVGRTRVISQSLDELYRLLTRTSGKRP